MKALWNFLRDMKCQLDLLNLLPTNTYYISTNIVQLFDFALRVKKLRIILVFFYFLWYFSVHFKFPWEMWTKFDSKFIKKTNFWTKLNFFVQFIQYTDNFRLLSKVHHFQNPTLYGKWIQIIFWDMSKHEICGH